MLLAGASTLAGTKAGNPWHGTWTEDGLALPNATVMEIPVQVDGGAEGWPALIPIDQLTLALCGPRHGDCLLARIPDVPVPETSAAEEGRGMEWTNWTLISGANRLLYGIPIRERRWIYVDASNRAWLAEIPNISTGNYLTLRFSSLVFGAEDSAVFETEVGPFSLPNKGIIFDASQTGRSVSWGTAFKLQPANVNYVFTPGVSRMDITGTPNVDIAVSLVADTLPDEVPIVWGNYGETVGGGDFSASIALFPYWIFDENTPVYLRWSVSGTADGHVWDSEGSVHSPRAITGTLSIVTSFGSHGFDFTATVSETRVIGSPDYWYYTTAFECDLGFSWERDQIDAGDAFVIPGIFAVRLSNKVVEVYMTDDLGQPGDASDVFSICRVMPDRFQATGYATTFGAICAQYVSYHPVTKELVGPAESPVCFM